MRTPDPLDTRESTGSGPDPVLRRVERAALRFCVGAAGLSVLFRRGGLDVALGVLAGGGIASASYWAIKSGVDGLLRAWEGRNPVSRAGILLRLAGRYALLALIAYVMIARFRLHPIGLVIGVSSLFVAAAVEAIRQAAAPAGTGERGGPGRSR